MADFIYTTVPGKIKPLLAKIREIDHPYKERSSSGYRGVMLEF
jgi:hypothetical protein